MVMKNNPMCDNCNWWKEIALGHIGTCGIKASTTKWSGTCDKYLKDKKEKENEKL